MDGHASTTPPAAAQVRRRRRHGFRAFLGRVIGTSFYLLCSFSLLAVVVGALSFIPGVKPLVREGLTHAVQRVVGVALSTSQDFQMREALRQQLVDLRHTIEESSRDIRRTLHSKGGGGGGGGGVAMSAIAGPSEVVVQGAPADVRPLPFPFHAYVSVASDPDAMKFSDFERIHELLHDEYQLNLSDQLFIANSGQAKVQTGIDLKLGDEHPMPTNLERLHKLLLAHRRGTIEGIHGWHSGAFASVESSFRLEVEKKWNSKFVKVTGMDNYDPADHNYVVFEYRMPQAGSYCELKKDANTLIPVKSQVDGTVGMAEAVTWTQMFAELPAGMVDPELEFKLYGEPKAHIEVRNLMITNFAQSRVAAEARFLEEYNLRFLYYSEHSRARNELSSGLRVDVNNNARANVLIDNPSQAPTFYVMPYLEQIGVTFINASHHTAQYNALPIGGLTHPHRFNDGVVRYNFKRFMAVPKNEEGNFFKQTMDMTWEPWMGFHVDRLLRNCTRLGDGGVVYTHWGAGNPSETILSDASKQQLEILRERYYNISGKTPYWKRVWVAPVSEVLLFSRAQYKLRDNAFYDDTNNTVHIRSWYDEVSRQTIPWSNTRAFGLAHQTFYVNDAVTAKLTIDGRPYTCLKRNGPDHTGRESITIVDDYTPSVVLDEVDPLQKFGDVVSDNAACYFRLKGGFRGAKCLEMQLEDTQGSSTWTIPELSTAYTDTIRFAYRKTNPAIKAGLRIQFEDDTSLEITEGRLSQTQPGWQLSPRTNDEWHDVAVDLVSVQMPHPIKRIPRGKVKSITLLAEDGANGDSVFYDAIEFLRNPIHPPNTNRRMLVAGRIDPPQDDVKIVLDDGQMQHQTVTKQGYFFFPEAAVRGTVVKVFAETENKVPHYPLSGRYIELLTNEVELQIPLQDLRDAKLSANLQKTYKAVSELNSDVGRIYKPRSDYVHSGIGTPQEYENKLQINNVGFLDRDRRIANPDNARRILFLGNCNLFGHSTPRSWHGNVLLEDMLVRSTGYPTEVITLADSSMSFGKHWSYYQGLGKKFRADLACIFVHSSGVEMLEADPDLFARYYEYAPDRFPCTLFRSQKDGTLQLIEPDPEYFQHIGKDEQLHKEREEEKKKGGYYTAGVDWLTVYFRKEWKQVPPAGQKAWEHFARVLKHYQQELAKDGTRLMIVLTPEAQRMYGGTFNEFKDAEGFECNSKVLGERMEKLCNSLGVGYFNLTPYIEKEFPDANMYIWRHDAHPSPYGFQMIASGVHDYLLSTNFCEVLPSNDPSTADKLFAYLTQQASR